MVRGGSTGQQVNNKPFWLKPFWLKPFWLKPFWLKAFWLKPFWLKPFWLKPFWLKPMMMMDVNRPTGQQRNNATQDKTNRIPTKTK